MILSPIDDNGEPIPFATRRCVKCGIEKHESEIQLSHDFPRYAGGTDRDGRTLLCKRCHDVYERLVASVIVKYLLENVSKDVEDKLKLKVRMFNQRWLRRD